MDEKEKAMEFASGVAEAYEKIWSEPEFKRVRDKYFRIMAKMMDECGIEPTVENVTTLKLLVFKKVIWELYESKPDFREKMMHCVKYAG